MQPSTSSTGNRTISINGMTGAECVQKVTDALKSVQGVTVQSVKVGTAVISGVEQSKCHAACAAVNAAGFKSRETTGATGEPQSGCTLPNKEHVAVNNSAAKKVEPSVAEVVAGSVPVPVPAVAAV